MDDEGLLTHDPAARLGTRNLGGPDGLERLADAEVPSDEPPPTPDEAEADTAAAVTAAAPEPDPAPRRRAADASAPGSRTALLAGGVLLAFALVVVVGTVLRSGSDGGTDTDTGAEANAVGPGTDSDDRVDRDDRDDRADRDDDASGRPTATVPRTTATTAPPDRAPAEGECAWPDPQAATPGAYLSLACNDDRATVRLERALTSPPAPGNHCPVGTDVVLDVPAGDGGPAALWCMRNVHPPHPGDPGKGGGELLVGDCLATQTDGRSVEVPCDGSAGVSPQYVVRASPDAMGACPAGSVGSITVEAPLPGTYCVGYA